MVWVFATRISWRAAGKATASPTKRLRGHVEARLNCKDPEIAIAQSSFVSSESLNTDELRRKNSCQVAVGSTEPFPAEQQKFYHVPKKP